MNGFKPGGETCGLTRSEAALAYVDKLGVVSQAEVDDWTIDVYLALGYCARNCPEAGRCLASKLLISVSEAVETNPHPRHLEVAPE